MTVLFLFVIVALLGIGWGLGYKAGAATTESLAVVQERVRSLARENQLLGEQIDLLKSIPPAPEVPAPSLDDSAGLSVPEEGFEATQSVWRPSTTIQAVQAAYHPLPAKVERWRLPLRDMMKRHHVWTQARENKALHIIYGESRGNTNTGHLNGCYGLFQFGTGWKHHGGYDGHHHADWRKCGYCSAHRFVHVWKVGGTKAIKRHWAATYW